MRSINEHKQERGVTILLVAVCLAALLAMAALAIDVVTLYVARTEAQRASDAAALAGARLFAGPGYTSQSASPTSADVCQSGGPSLAAANAVAGAVATQNQVAGRNVLAGNVAIACNTLTAGNPQIQVTIQQTNIPTFFARIWGRTASSVSATSTAEAYNPSGAVVPISVSGVKPWLVPNCDPTNTGPVGNPACTGAAYLVDPTSGAVENTGASSPVGQTIVLAHVAGNNTPNAHTTPVNYLDYYRLNIPVDSTKLFCPSTSAVSCAQVGSDDYLDNIACSSTNPTDTSLSTTSQFTCGQTIGAGETVTVLSAGGYGARTDEGAQCLIHAGGTGLCQDQDVFTPSGATSACAASNPSGTGPVRIDGGNNNPNSVLQGVENISRSDSVVTVPIYQGGTGGNLCPPPSGACTQTGTVVGFLQLGITQNVPDASQPNAGSRGKIEGVILNVVGCNSTPSGTPVTGGGVSTIPVRLIHQ